MGSKRTPPPPDYTGAANAQAQASRENLNTQNFANRPNINTPFGSESWTTRAVTDPATGQQVTEWTQNTSLDPRLQNALDSQIGIQQGRSDLANAFMGRVQGEYQQPFDWNSLPSLTSAGTPGQLQTGLADYTPGLQTSVRPRGVVSSLGPLTSGSAAQPATGNFARGANQAPMRIGSDAWQPIGEFGADDLRYNGGSFGLAPSNNRLALDMGPGAAQPTAGFGQQGVVSGFNFGGPQMGVSPMVRGLATNTGTEQVQRGLATGDNPALPQIDNTYRDRVATDLMSAMLPAQQIAQQSLETDLSNRGFKVGTRGYQRAMDDLGGRQAAERYNALGQAGQEAQRLFGMQMGARQQAFNEDVSGGQFANQAANQAFGQGLAANQFRNQAVGQAFNQALGAGQFGNQAQSQLYGQLMGQADLANRAGQQAFSQDLAAGQFGNQAMNQAQNLDINRMQAMNQAQQQQFGQNMQYANMMNQLRQQAIAEQQQRRGMSLNEMNALLTGQQVGMPQMPRFNASGVAETPQLLNAANMQYQAGMDAFNAQQQGMANTMGGLSSLASTAFMFSDRRLKRRVKRVGTHADLGVGIYEYEMAGFAQRGVIAQEVAAVRPDLVKRHASGYLMVDYGRVAA
jgi:hypothetical protein